MLKFLILSVLAFMACEQLGRANAPDSLRIAMIALGSFSEDRLDDLESGLRQQLDGSPFRLDRIKLPSGAYYPPKSRYRADKLVDMLSRRYGGHYHKVIGLTEADISTSTPKYYDYGIFGLGELSGKACVVSVNRLRRRLPKGAEAGERRLRERLLKVSVHEIGHTLGLDHCLHRKCVMAAGEGSIRDVDRGSVGFCPRCLKLAGA